MSAVKLNSINSPYFPHMQAMIIRDQTTGNELPQSFRKVAIVIAGQASYTEMGQTLPIKAGTIFTIPGARQYEFVDRHQFECVIIAYHTGLLTPYVGILGAIPGYKALFRIDRMTPKARRWPSQFQLDGHNLAPISKLSLAIARTLSARKPGFEVAATGLFLQLISALIRACTPVDTAVGDRTRGIVAATIAFLETNYAEPVTLPDLARRAHTSVNNLVRLFNNATDMPPIEYLIHLRILKACEHLTNPACQAKEVAFMVGFHDANYFARQFRQIMGMPPSQFRRHSAHNPFTRQSPIISRMMNRASRR